MRVTKVTRADTKNLSNKLNSLLVNTPDAPELQSLVWNLISATSFNSFKSEYVRNRHDSPQLWISNISIADNSSDSGAASDKERKKTPY